MRLMTATALTLIVASTVPAAAYTQRDTNACMSDAFRLCASSIPDAHRVAGCLYVKRSQLSAACAGAFARYSRTGARAHRHRPYVSRD